MINLIKDINLLLEDFSFQSRGLKGREEEKENIKKKKLNKIFSSLGCKDLNELENKIKNLYEEIGLNFDAFNFYERGLNNPSFALIEVHEINIKLYNCLSIYLDGIAFFRGINIRIINWEKLKDKIKEIIKDGSNLNEDFSFQSRNIKGRKEEKNKTLQLQLDKIISQKVIDGDLYLTNYQEILTTLGNIEIVRGDLDLEFCTKLKDLGNLKQVRGNLRLSGTTFTSLPDDLYVRDMLFLIDSNIYEIPKNFKIDGFIKRFGRVFNVIKEYNDYCKAGLDSGSLHYI